MQQQKGFDYTTQLLERSRNEKDRYHEASAMFCYVRYYFSKNPDSMYFWMQKALPLFNEQKRYVEYFRMKAWYIYVLTRSKKNEEALKYVTDLSNNLGEEGVALYEEVLKSMEMRNAPLIKRINIIRQLMNKAHTSDLKMKYTRRLDDYVKICKDRKITWLDEEMPIYYLEYVVHRHYALAYIDRKEFREALVHLQKAQALLNKYEMYNYGSELKTIYAAYYKQNKEYDKALAIYDSLLPVWRMRNSMSLYLEMLKDKADVLLDAGRNRSAWLIKSMLL